MSVSWVPNPDAPAWRPDVSVENAPRVIIEESVKEEIVPVVVDTVCSQLEELQVVPSRSEETVDEVSRPEKEEEYSSPRPVSPVAKEEENIENTDDPKGIQEASLLVSEGKRITLAEELVVEQEIGVGAFGRVSKVRHGPSGRYYAMKAISKKVLRRKKISQAEWRLERDVLVKIEPHPYVVELVSAFQTVACFYLVMKYLPGGELFDLLRRSGTFLEEVAAFYAAETALALEHLHTSNIIHRDLKPENLLLDEDGHVVVTDFGLAKMFQSHDEVHRTLCGTDAYMAPEMVARRSYGYAVDLWSLGILIFEMVTGKTPFLAKDTKELHRKILSEKVKFPPFLDASTIHCLRGLLERQVPKRLGAAKGTMFQVGGFDALKQHPFFKRIEWQPLFRRESPPPLTLKAIAPSPFILDQNKNKSPRIVADDLVSETNWGSEDAGSTVADFDFLRDGAFEPLQTLSPGTADRLDSFSSSQNNNDDSSSCTHWSSSSKGGPFLNGLASPTSSQCDVSSSCASDSFTRSRTSPSSTSLAPKKPRPPRKRKKKTALPSEPSRLPHSSSGGSSSLSAFSGSDTNPRTRAASPLRNSMTSNENKPRLASIPGSPHLQPHHSAPDLSHLASLSPGGPSKF